MGKPACTFLLWETSSHLFAILGVSHIINPSAVCPPIWWCPPPDTTILGGFIIYGQRCIMVSEKSKANLTNAGAFKRNTRETQQKIARMGAEASNRKQAEKKSYRECAKYISELAVKDPKEIQSLTDMGIDENEMTQAMALTYAMILKAKKGNSQMARLVMELMGQVKEQQTNVTINNTNPYANLTEDELRKLAKDE